MAPMRTYTLRWSSKFTHIYKNASSPSSIFMKFVSDHSLYEKSAVHACVGLLCVSTSSDQVQNLHAALTSCYLHLLFSWSFSNITSSMRNQPCMQVLGFCAWVHTPIKFFSPGRDCLRIMKILVQTYWGKIGWKIKIKILWDPHSL